VPAHQASLRSFHMISNIFLLRIIQFNSTSEILCFFGNDMLHPVCLLQRFVRSCNVSSFNSSKTKITTFLHAVTFL